MSRENPSLPAVLLAPFDPSRRATRRSAVIHALCAGVFLWIGAYSASQAVPVFREAWRAESWPEAPGRVLRSHVVETREGKYLRQTLVVEYTWIADGRAWTGSRWRLGDPTCAIGRGMAQAAAGRFPEGARVDVRYDPVDPSSAVLDPTPGESAWTLAVVAAIGGALGGLWLFEGLRILRAA